MQNDSSPNRTEREAELAAEVAFLERLCRQNARNADNAVAALKRSLSWRATAPLRFAADCVQALRRRLKKPAPEPLRPIPLLSSSTLFAPSDELARQRAATPRHAAAFCVAVPLSNPLDERLAALRDSLLAQTFPDWELCVADASPPEDAARHERILRGGAGENTRLRFTRIAADDEAALLSAAAGLSTAPLVLVLGQDDQLAPDALFRLAEVAEEDAAFCYADGLLVRDGFRFDASCASDVVSVQPRPDFSLDAFRGHDFIGRGFVCPRTRLVAAGGFRAEAGSATTTDLLFRLCESGGRPVHVAAPLFAQASPFRPLVPNGTTPETRIADARRAVESHLARTGTEAIVETPHPDRPFFRVRPPRPDPAPLVSVLIPNRENPGVLRVCVESILAKTLYPNIEIVITESGSTSPETFALYDRLSKDPRVKIVRFPKDPNAPFNFSAKCNFGAAQCRGEFILLLNSDTEVIAPDWIDEMLGFAARSDVGVVGALLLYGNGTVQHAGILHRPGGLPGHVERHTPALAPGGMGRLLHVQEYQSVTFACAMAKMSTWRDLGGLDESFAVAYNDVDFCFRARERGLKVVWTPFAKLFHHESVVRGSDYSGPSLTRFLGEIAHLRERWGDLLAAPDPFFGNMAFTSLRRN